MSLDHVKTLVRNVKCFKLSILENTQVLSMHSLRMIFQDIKVKTSSGVLQPKHVYPYVGTATRKHGISALTLTSCGSRLFSSCTDDNIYMYNTRLDTK